jgi:GTP-binding protein
MELDNSDELKRANWLFAQECNFIAGANNWHAIPEFTMPEIAFAGRSNVGKSSLINAITGRNSLARVSHTPGRTKQLNFFSLRDLLTLVDLPGYGYARASKNEIAGWNKLINKFLKARPVLKRVCILIDSRHGLKDSDQALMTMLDEVAVNYQIILTKIDKSNQDDLSIIIKKINDLMPNHPALHPEIILTSSNKNIGIDHLRIELTKFVTFDE